jgi:hypothetical protein
VGRVLDLLCSSQVGVCACVAGMSVISGACISICESFHEYDHVVIHVQFSRFGCRSARSFLSLYHLVDMCCLCHCLNIGGCSTVPDTRRDSRRGVSKTSAKVRELSPMLPFTAHQHSNDTARLDKFETRVCCATLCVLHLFPLFYQSSIPTIPAI